MMEISKEKLSKKHRVMILEMIKSDSSLTVNK